MSRHSVLIVGGCGHVGLPFGIVLARAGADVALYDTDRDRADRVRRGSMPFLEYGAQPLLEETLGRTLHVVDEPVEAEYVVITIGTPVDHYLNPRYKPLFDLVEALEPQLRGSENLVLRSTIFPGTTRELTRHLAALDLPVRLTYCPERIAQGYAITELDRLPQIVAGFSDEAINAALDLFHHVTDRTLVVGVEEAELAKLFLNAWRYIQFAIANQFYMIAEEHGADFGRVRHAMTWGYERADQFPSPGFTAGPCLLKDTLQLSALEGNRFQLGHAAMLVNEGLANFIVDRLRTEFDLAEKTVGVLGMAFKANSDDTRDSLAFKLRKLLRFHGARVLASDPFVSDPEFVAAEELIRDSDIVVLAAPHDAYRDLSVSADKTLVDVWGFFGRERVEVPAR